MPELLFADGPVQAGQLPGRYAYRHSLRSRVIALVLALAMSLAMLAILVWMGAIVAPLGTAGSHLTSVRLNDTRAKAKAQTAASVVKAAQLPPPVAILAPLVQPPAVKLPTLNLILLTRQEMAQADIGKMARPETSSSGAGAPGSGKTLGPGEGPGGVQLFRAQWYREPYDAELAGYMPHRELPPGSWATIACRTIDHFHVEDCRELAESPPGSGLSRALRQAAWQFLVRPPRIDGKSMVGTWVSIRFDFIRRQRSAPGEAEAGDSSGAQ